jgi:soluble lytic murein transglycosylase
VIKGVDSGMKTVYKLLVIAGVVAVILIGIRLQNQRGFLSATQETVVKQEILISKLEGENKKLQELMYINDVLNTYYSRKPLKMRRILSELIYLSARENNLSAEMIMAVILTESSFKDDAISNKGAMGLMQLLPSTAASIAEDLKIQWRGDRTLYDSQHNIRLGAYYLRKMMEVFDDMNTALTAYNAGPGYVINQTQQGKPYSDVYAKKVNENYRMLRKVYFNN